MHRRALFLFSSLCLLSSVSIALATDYSSTNFKVSNPVIEELGGFATSTHFQLIGSMPYIEPLRATSTNFKNIPGFLGYPGSTTLASATPVKASFTGGSGGATPPPGPAKPKPTPTEEIRNRVDFNHDGRVDFIDFSILLYYFDKTGARIAPFDLNSDGVVDVVDISIFMYYWDGN